MSGQRPEWFNLFQASSGKLRALFKFQPVDVFSFSSSSRSASMVELDTESSQRAGWQGATKYPTGVFKVSISSAKDLNKELLGGKTSAYCRVRVNGKQRFRTDYRPGDLNPVWNDTHYHVVSSMHDKFEFEVMDHSQLQKDRALGKVICRASELKDGKFMESTDVEVRIVEETAKFSFPLKEIKNDGKIVDSKGTLQVEVTFFPVQQITKIKTMTMVQTLTGFNGLDSPSDIDSQNAMLENKTEGIPTEVEDYDFTQYGAFFLLPRFSALCANSTSNRIRDHALENI